VAVEVAVVAAVEVLVDLRRDERREQLLGELVVRAQALPLQVVLIQAHRLEPSRRREELVRHLVVSAVVPAVDQVVSLLRAIPVIVTHGAVASLPFEGDWC
jgi:hypothetical protein